MKINTTTIKNGIAYGWTMSKKPRWKPPNPMIASYKSIINTWMEGVNKAKAEAIEWEDQSIAVRDEFGKPFDGDYYHEPIDVEISKKCAYDNRLIPMLGRLESSRCKEGHRIKCKCHQNKVLVIKPTESIF